MVLSINAYPHSYYMLLHQQIFGNAGASHWGKRWHLQVLACNFVTEQPCTDFRSALNPALVRALQPRDLPSEIPLLREKLYAQSRAGILRSTEYIPHAVSSSLACLGWGPHLSRFSSNAAVSAVPCGKRSRECKKETTDVV